MDFLIYFFKEHKIFFLILLIISIITIIKYLFLKYRSVETKYKNCNNSYSGNYVGRDKNINNKSSNDEIIVLIEEFYKEGDKNDHN